MGNRWSGTEYIEPRKATKIRECPECRQNICIGDVYYDTFTGLLCAECTRKQQEKLLKRRKMDMEDITNTVEFLKVQLKQF